MGDVPGMITLRSRFAIRRNGNFGPLGVFLAKEMSLPLAQLVKEGQGYT